LWGRGMNSSLDKTCVGMGESTPFLRSRSDFRIHIFCCPSFFKVAKVSREYDSLLLPGRFARTSVYQENRPVNTFHFLCSGSLEILTPTTRHAESRSRPAGAR